MGVYALKDWSNLFQFEELSQRFELFILSELHKQIKFSKLMTFDIYIYSDFYLIGNLEAILVYSCQNTLLSFTI